MTIPPIHNHTIIGCTVTLSITRSALDVLPSVGVLAVVGVSDVDVTAGSVLAGGVSVVRSSAGEVADRDVSGNSRIESDTSSRNEELTEGIPIVWEANGYSAIAGL